MPGQKRRSQPFAGAALSMAESSETPKPNSICGRDGVRAGRRVPVDSGPDCNHAQEWRRPEEEPPLNALIYQGSLPHP